MSEWRRVQGVVVAASFSLLLAGTNATTPLLPLYRGVLGFTPGQLSLTFVSYVTAITVVLFGLSRSVFVRWSPVLICAALALSVVADLLIAGATLHQVLVGRMLTGVACGMGTGSAAALVVAALGPKARSISATGNLVGAVIGTSVSQLCVTFSGLAATHQVFHIHAAACAVMLVLVAPVLRHRRAHNHLALKPATKGTDEASNAPPMLVPLLVGCCGWLGMSGAVTFLPTYFAESGLPLAQALGVIVLMICSAGGQLLSPALTRRAPWLSGLAGYAAGLVLIAAARLLGSSALAILGCGAIGFGIGVSYRLALVVITRGATPAQQGTRASLYAATTYAAAAASVLGAGSWANTTSIPTVVTQGSTLLATLALLLLPIAPRLRDTRE